MTHLCEQARSNNKIFEITGVLACKSGRFLQVLEGPKEAVEDTFLRIVRDDRHHDLLLLSRRVTTRREFGEWDMAYREDRAQIDEVAARVAELTASAAEPVRQAFADFLNAPD
ncbi:BLUF domain-containing protein [Sphingomonas sp. QA11]|uniref:BLUF domain-containing protein n=1 Tax=Sphingomonas sp. QA11 TaxID=2950605 RepID=UPI003FA71BF3